MTTILVVDDSAVERHRAGSLLENRPGLTEGERRTSFRVVYAATGQEALSAIRQSPPDLVFTYLQMPDMNGLELVECIRQDYPALPVILMTAHGSEEIAVQALRQGAASYVPKRSLAQDLLETAENILAMSRAAREQQRVLECLTQSESKFVLHNDRSLIAPLIGFLQNGLERLRFGDTSGRLRVTVALREALINAIEHGNLEVPSLLRENDDQAYHRLLEERLQQAPYRDRRVHVTVRESPEEVLYVVRDEGPGFDPADLPDPLDPANLEKASGRGLLLIRTFMDEVRHQARGQEITMMKRRSR